MSETVGSKSRIAVITGARAEFGLLETVMRAIQSHEQLELIVFVAGVHLLAPAYTGREVAARFRVTAEIPMQTAAAVGRFADAKALGRGVLGFAEAFEKATPRWVVVLGDRIEAFAAASAASIGGVPVAHLHAGDRAEGVADEAMRHAITKLSHLHLAATRQSADRVIQMGEEPSRVHVVGSPAIDGLAEIEPMGDEAATEIGDPDIVFLMHPIGDPDQVERARAGTALGALRGKRVLALHPNHDPGRNGILAAVQDAGVASVNHLPRERFLSLLKRLAEERSSGAMVGNSSAGLIEAAAIRLPVVDIGSREGGRERPNNVVWTPGETLEQVEHALQETLAKDRSAITHPYGGPGCGRRVAELLARESRGDARKTLRKRCTY